MPADAAPAGAVGHDVSYPQCTSSGATTSTIGGLGGDFGIVGVTGGRPWGANSCSGAEYSWAVGRPDSPGLYMNTANPAPTSSYYWPSSGTSDPALCSNAASTTDPGCAYDYGWHAAAEALTKEASALAGASTRTWWLDVETANSWNGDATSNAADLQGAIDYLRAEGVPSVGIYSTTSQWSSITGGYSTANASSYATAWAPEFAPRYPMTSAPLWIAGVGSASSANTACGTSFTGGPTQLAQYADGSGIDADLVCGAPAQSFSMSLSPSSGSAPAGARTTTTISVVESGPAQAVALSARAPAGLGITISPTTMSGAGTATMTVQISPSLRRGSYSVTVNGQGATGTQQLVYSLKVTR